ncbi:hypothetical protein BT93_L4775 [Corymbia citriodora subsp. variegata]|nr:hypothetical protein BT93_L4775 [Corymbia citriodora subsp. variegata]
MYTLEQFEAKSKAFARSQLGMVKEVSPEVVEALFWQAALEKPIYVEYANDVPGSGFGEQDGRFRYFHRRRRMKVDYHRHREGIDSKNNEVDNVKHSYHSETKDLSRGDDSSGLEAHRSPTSQSGIMPEETSRACRRSNSGSNELEGTAGWKLSNSPWNLQVIARSSGSLTRFMPDDIPGVTSPMVYIGMLFSWFAWHVEDHELHSMNFLHMGSPKTWYAVPGDYAFSFEEVLRKEAYGGNMDRLAVLSLLGEKTTLLSPDVIVAASIPCCRLIQNPGEFVVTFPRAYHIGFSHGFNCGEAANFATPQWLRFAKEAAVRRAAMNYLPMLSHQQLLYLLTMSFVSRVPMSLIPGARSSRLKDRLREERELSVKKAFLEDILNENDLLSSLLRKESTIHAVIWNPHMLPSLGKGSQSPDGTAVISSSERENSHHYSGNDSSINLFKEMTMFMEALNDSYVGKDDLFFDFQVDSGTLPCVACGILGFPFMSVIQPSETASAALLPTKHYTQQTCEDRSNISDTAPPPMQLQVASNTDSEKGMGSSGGLLRPRIFCLEHAIQTEELLRSKGGANVLVICHSDYQKMKAYAGAIAEEIGVSFKYKDIPFDPASEEDLNLIDLAIDDQECTGYRDDDWTSKLGINLRYCVKARKNSPSNRVQHALALGGLFSEESPSTILNLKWKSRRSRSRTRLDTPEKCEPCDSLQRKGYEVSRNKLDSDAVKKEETILQYTRRNAKFKPGSSTGTSRSSGCYDKQPVEVSLAIAGEVHLKSNNQTENTYCGTENPVCKTAAFPVGLSDVSHEIQVLEATTDLTLDMIPAQVASSLASVTTYVGNVEVQIINQALEQMNVKQQSVGSATYTSQRHSENEFSQNLGGQNEILVSTDSCFPTINETEENFDTVKATKTTEVSDSDIVNDSEFAEVPSVPSPSSSLCAKVTSGCKVHGETAFLELKDGHNVKGNAVACTEATQCGTPMGPHPHVCSGIDEEEHEIHGTGNQSVPSLSEACTEAPKPTSSEEQGSSYGSAYCESPEKDWTANATSDENPEVCSVEITDQHSAASDQECSHVQRDFGDSKGEMNHEHSPCQDDRESQTMESTKVDQVSTTRQRRKRRSELETIAEDQLHCSGFIRSPCEGLRPRAGKDATNGSDCISSSGYEKSAKKARESRTEVKPRKETASFDDKKEKRGGSYRCDMEGCRMRFKTRAELMVHKRNRCPVEGCGKRFSSHKYAVLHQRVHEDDRPLKCPWKGCNMTFKWAWARTEHIRVHTGERPYKCKVEGCGLSFRFVSDFSRHRRKTGHYVS